jgi:uncharacterized protein YacL
MDPKVAQVIVFIVNVAFSAWFLTYLTALEKKGCKCALTWHRQAMMAFIIISLIVSFGMLFTEPNSPLRMITNIIMLPISISYIVISLVYIMQLKKENCECSKDPARTTIEVFAWISVALAGLVLLLGVLALIVGVASKKM